MDDSLNTIDLEYLINPIFAKTTSNITKSEKNNYEEDIKFYKKRIFKVTKDMLRGKKIETDIDKAFMNYTKACIEYFKFIDKAEIIQKDYKMYSQKSTTKKDIASIVMPDHLLMGTPPAITKTIPECYPVKVTNKKKKITFFPKRRDIDIKNPELKVKGLKKKNVNNKYEQNEKTEKKKKKEQRKKKKKKNKKS